MLRNVQSYQYVCYSECELPKRGGNYLNLSDERVLGPNLIPIEDI